MTTIDQMIERLQELKDITQSGDTPVCVKIEVAGVVCWEEAMCEIQNVKVEHEDVTGEPVYRYPDEGDETTQIVSII